MSLEVTIRVRGGVRLLLEVDKKSTNENEIRLKFHFFLFPYLHNW